MNWNEVSHHIGSWLKTCTFCLLVVITMTKLTQAHRHSSTLTHTHMYTHTHTCTLIHAHTHTHTHTHTHRHTHTHTHKYASVILIDKVLNIDYMYTSVNVILFLSSASVDFMIRLASYWKCCLAGYYWVQRNRIAEHLLHLQIFFY